MVPSCSRSSFSLEDNKQSSHPFLPAPRPSLRTRLLTRRNLLISLPITFIVLFCVIFFPVTFARQHHTTDVTDAWERANPAKSAAKVGAVWRQAVGFKDLDDFRIKYYSSGRNNSEVLTGELPGSALVGNVGRRSEVEEGAVRRWGSNRAVHRQVSTTTHTHTPSSSTSSAASTSIAHARSSSPSSTASTSTNRTAATASSASTGGGSVLSILYPAHSYTPSANPVGGTQFYALSPFNLALASSVTLNYSVFFPASYDFVQGGKLPGLYGGTEGCGGGNPAEDCWSSRMAWRTEGAGELYAYLPQDRQNTSALLAVPPYSYVNSDYGISLGRGSFEFARGQWTNVSQTITLSTKGKQNGVFDVKVNGRQVIYYDQVYYPARIKGILFSTFFGGATPDWATPVDQHSYFRGFSVRINALG